MIFVLGRNTSLIPVAVAAVVGAQRRRRLRTALAKVFLVEADSAGARSAARGTPT